MSSVSLVTSCILPILLVIAFFVVDAIHTLLTLKTFSASLKTCENDNTVVMDAAGYTRWLRKSGSSYHSFLNLLLHVKDDLLGIWTTVPIIGNMNVLKETVNVFEVNNFVKIKLITLGVIGTLCLILWLLSLVTESIKDFLPSIIVTLSIIILLLVLTKTILRVLSRFGVYIAIKWQNWQINNVLKEAFVKYSIELEKDKMTTNSIADVINNAFENASSTVSDKAFFKSLFDDVLDKSINNYTDDSNRNNDLLERLKGLDSQKMQDWITQFQTMLPSANFSLKMYQNQYEQIQEKSPGWMKGLFYKHSFFTNPVKTVLELLSFERVGTLITLMVTYTIYASMSSVQLAKKISNEESQRNSHKQVLFLTMLSSAILLAYMITLFLVVFAIIKLIAAFLLQPGSTLGTLFVARELITFDHGVFPKYLASDITFWKPFKVYSYQVVKTICYVALCSVIIGFICLMLLKNNTELDGVTNLQKRQHDRDSLTTLIDNFQIVFTSISVCVISGRVIMWLLR